MLTSKKWYAVVALLFMGLTSFSQQNKIDSLNLDLKQYNEKHKNAPLSLSDSVKVIILNDLFYYHVNYEQQLAFDYTTEALELSKKINYKKGTARSYANLARVYNSRANFDMALKALEKSNAIFASLKDDLNLGYNYSEMGVVFSKKGNFPEALNHLIKGLKNYEKAGDQLSVGYNYVNIGILYKLNHDYKMALDYYFKAMNIFKKINNVDARFGLAGTNNNIGNVYLEQGKYKESLAILKKNLGEAEEFDSAYIFAETYQSIGENYRRMGQYDLALAPYTTAIAYCKQIEDRGGMANSLIHMGYCYFKKGDMQKAFNSTNQGLELAKELGLLEMQRNAYKYLAEMYSTQKSYKPAYENQVLFKKINDSLFTAEKDKKITQMQMQYDFDKMQDEAQQVQKEKILKLNQETDKQRTIKYIVMIALFCVTVLTFGVFVNLKKNQKQKNIIKQQKDIVEEQHEVIQKSLNEKETLLREIHHRVKNNLQIISSLLNIQSQGIQDENILSSIQEGQSRVQAMSLIHQNLYQSEHLSNVDIENYLRELVVYLSDMFVGNDKTIQVDVEASHIQFDIDTAIPLGLIVNELVSNAYKYAFDKRDSGKIKIEIKAVNAFEYELKVNDDGKGLPADFDPKKSQSLGLKLVNILSRQLRGALKIDSDNGTSFIVSFKDIKAYQSSIS